MCDCERSYIKVAALTGLRPQNHNGGVTLRQ